VLRQVVLTAQLAGHDAPSTSQDFGGIQPELPFALACRLLNEAIYTPAGVFPLPLPTDPLFTVARGSAAVAPDERDQYALDRARRLEGAAELEVEATKPVEIDGLPGVQLCGLAPARPQTLFVHQTMLFGDSEYCLLVGMCTPDVRSRFEPLFRQMSASFRRGPCP
jgi:hypothetical protein